MPITIFVLLVFLVFLSSGWRSVAVIEDKKDNKENYYISCSQWDADADNHFVLLVFLVFPSSG